jgi:tetratricopeptide (TPR) repeat protein
MDLFVAKAHLTKEVNRDAVAVAWMCSSPLNAWGVELQKANQLTNARTQFERALELNSENVVAQINLRCNTNLQKGLKISAHLPRSIEDAFGSYRNWDQVLSENGPFDDPNFCFEQGKVYVGGNLYRQGFLEFARVTVLDPDRLDPRLWLAHLYVMSHRPDEALEVTQYIHAHAQKLGLTATNQTPLLFVETSAYLAKTNSDAAKAAVQAALELHPGGEEVLGTAAQVYMDYGINGPPAGRAVCFSNALAIIEKQLKLAPDNLNALVNKGFVCLQINALDQGLAACSRVLQLQTNNPSALFNRAIFHLRLGQLDESQQDYETLQKAAPTSYEIFYGLQEIAYRKKDTNSAIRDCQLYLANAPTNTAEAYYVSARLKELSPHGK